MAWEYKIHTFPKKGWVQKHPVFAEDALNLISRDGWTLFSISDSEGFAVFRRPAANLDSGGVRQELTAGLAEELRELIHAIEELDRA